MSITYEEALSTLEAMFAAPWNRELLDAVLRHEKGHMENTCDRILNHGDQDPKILVDRLKAGGAEPQVAMDEELARQLAGGGSSQKSKKKKGRGTPTSLPDDFLRIPGYKRTAAAAASAASATGGAIDDETLARMLQDELFSEELARNPDFAHLARGGAGNRARSNARMPPAARRPGSGQAGPPQANPFEGTMEKLSAMGMGARTRLAMFAKNFEHKMQNLGNPEGQPDGHHLQENAGAAAERRGLLDDNDDEEDVIEFEMKKTM
mmetsp:Transcript_103975/g.155715  ORF Transcript_103975/g.155715 Transcript_103975/m.155715 type:complete len:265 (+) Transcript_103975:197-991(+)|eukprot:CAMPEP_0117040528 /NCGR_PEP_ID=MMETSP0472-20121206/28356_1 /TAXON_ID=693140 ORGANISM="Tiarina fusus, Strain LIS" /NCGR_SAMPLE_ID=MMETSP0472 /ASSEMBLY_ACC=CAM_ASM_000603 /LENGTH=264 /DNA_ID=CAMNT_0004751283 /DNA_START=192 /DNA_END=986 /DNA_ORIENTATION=-